MSFDYSILGDSFSLPFKVKSFSSPSVLWLNESWWIRNGYDVDENRAALNRWLIEEFAVSVPAPTDPPQTFIESEKYLFADRYGLGAPGAAGGSGRCGARGIFNAKGVGRTPLVGPDTEWHHSHGVCWLDEAIREAVCAQLTYLECPNRAVPVVAILDTGAQYHSPDGSSAGRRAIVVRPNFIRLGHLQRNAHFGDAGHPKSEQVKDSERVAAVASALFGPNHLRNEMNVRSSSIEEAFTRSAETVGFSLAHRLWLGNFISSNFTLDGEPLDFGGVRSVPSWLRWYGNPTEPPFGGEVFGLGASVISVYRQLAKLGRVEGEELKLVDRIQRRISRSFDAAILCSLVFSTEVISIHKKKFESIISLFGEYYNHQQNMRDSISCPTNFSWGYRCFVEKRSDRSVEGRLRDGVLSVVADICEGHPDGERHKAALYASLVDFLKPRPSLYWESSRRRIENLIVSGIADRGAQEERVDRLITMFVGRSRRVWPHKPSHLLVTASRFDGRSTVARCLDISTGRNGLWIEAPCGREGAVHIGKSIISSSDLEVFSPKVHDKIIYFAVEISSVRGSRADITGEGAWIDLP